MKQLAIILAAASILSCSRAQPVVSTNAAQATPSNRVDRSQTAIAHSTENQPKPVNPVSGGKWTQSGDPIDTSKFDEVISSAEGSLKAKPADDAAKKMLAEAYFQRGVALTQARQYASALGDYRRALKYDPDHEDSKRWIDQINGIYQMMKKEGPKEGEEPPPLPFKKEA
jgi:tetratricopeptide (TPR) repeat protein